MFGSFVPSRFATLVNLPEKSAVKSSDSHIVHAHGSNEIRFVKDDAAGMDLKRNKSRRPWERELVNFFSQVGELTMVPFGRLYRPEGIRVGYVPAVALRTPHTKEIEDGCPVNLADGESERLVQLLEITPTKRQDRINFNDQL
eukprot:s9789_g1.t1